MRALVMDFKDDKKVWNIADQFMFGKALLVCPVVESQYTKETGERRNPIRTTNYSETKSKSVYLPQGTQWYDFGPTRNTREAGQLSAKHQSILFLCL